MNDSEFDSVARKALAYDAGNAPESSWRRVQPVRFAWLPTIREILVCGAVSALALFVIGLSVRGPQRLPLNSSSVIQEALRHDGAYAMTSLNRVDGASPRKPLGL